MLQPIDGVGSGRSCHGTDTANALQMFKEPAPEQKKSSARRYRRTASHNATPWRWVHRAMPTYAVKTRVSKAVWRDEQRRGDPRLQESGRGREPMMLSTASVSSRRHEQIERNRQHHDPTEAGKLPSKRAR